MVQRLRTIRLVTERYNELQGLRLVIAGAMLAATCGGLLIAQARQRAVLIAIIVTFAAMLPCQSLLTRYYAARFGRIVVQVSRRNGLWLLAAMAIALALSGKPFGPGQLAGVFLIGAAGASWIAIRDWPLRGYHLLGAVAAAFGASIQLMAVHAQSLPSAQATAFLVFGLAYIPIGFLDHRLLASVMRPEAGLKSCATEER